MYGETETILIIIGAGLGVAMLMTALRQNTVLGYLAAGLLIGPSTLGVVTDIDTLTFIAHFGVVFLLFEIGLEMSLEKLRAARRWILGLGLAQMLISMGALALVIGPLLGVSWQVALALGGALALSSTAMVIKILSDAKEMGTAFGQRTLSILLLQDLAVVPLLILVPMLAGESEGSSPLRDIAMAVVKAGVAIGLAVLIGRYVLRPVFNIIAQRRSEELFTAMVLATVLGLGLLTKSLGVSMELGAFLAGLMLSETAFRVQIEAEIRPFQQLLLGLFFMTVGMQADLAAVAEDPLTMLMLFAVMMSVKIVILGGIGRVLGLSSGESWRLGLALCQGGEFAFVIITLGVQTQLMEQSLFAGVILPAVVLSMIATPFLIQLGRRIEERMSGTPSFVDEEASPRATEREADHLNRHVILCGFGRVGTTVAKVLERIRHPYIAIEADPLRVQAGRAKGFNVFFGDAADPDVMRRTGADHAATVVLTTNAPERMEKTIAMIQTNFPSLPIIARARDLAHKRRLREMGVSASVPEVFEGALQLGGRTLQQVGHAADEIELLLDALRTESLSSPLPRRPKGPDNGDEPPADSDPQKPDPALSEPQPAE